MPNISTNPKQLVLLYLHSLCVVLVQPTLKVRKIKQTPTHFFEDLIVTFDIS